MNSTPSWSLPSRLMLWLPLALSACAGPAAHTAAPAQGRDFLAAASTVWGDAPETVRESRPDVADLEQLLHVRERWDRASGEELRGLFELPTAELRASAQHEAALAALVENLPAGAAGERLLLQLAWLRHPAIRAARAEFEARLEGHGQVRFLGELIARYRSFTRQLTVRGGPGMALGSKRAQSSLTPYPGIDTLRGEMVQAGVEQAWQLLRREVVALSAAILRASADLAWLQARDVSTRSHLKLLHDLEPVLRTRIQTGARQSDLLDLQGEIAKRELETATIADEIAAALAVLNGHLGRTPRAAVGAAQLWMSLGPPAAEPAPPEPGLAEPRVEAATARLTRAQSALLLMAEMTLGPMDLGLSRMERGLGAQAGVARTHPVAPAPDARTVMNEALLREGRMRTFRFAAELAKVRLARDSGAHVARMEWAAAMEGHRVHVDELLPLARSSYESLRGGYRANTVSFTDLYAASRRVLDLELATLRTLRQAQYARARLCEERGVLPKGE